MPTIYIPQPDDEDRQGAINTLMDGLERLYPGQITIRRSIAVTTDIPQVLDLLSSLFPTENTRLENTRLNEAGAPAESPTAKKARRQPRSRKPGSNGSSGGPQPAHVERPIAKPESEPIADDSQESATEKNASSQFYKWKILATGKECNSLSPLMRYRKIQPGDRVMHCKLGLHEVAERGDGSLYLRRIAS